MRIAILADIHGNLPAFETALKHLRLQAPDAVVLAGDVVNGSPDSAACWQLACSTGYPMLRGNHERYVADFGTPRAAPEWSTELFTPLQWAIEQLTDEDRRAMAVLPFSLRLPEAPGLFFVHASARDDHDSVLPHTPEEVLERMFEGVPERWIVRAHNHYGQARLWERGVILTCGSVGLALDGNPTAQYLLLDRENGGWRVQHQSVPYDLEATRRRFHDTGYLDATGPMGLLFYREVLTASQQLVPFLRLFNQWKQEKPISLHQAVTRFLGEL